MTDPGAARPHSSADLLPLKRDLAAIGGVAGHIAHDFNNILAAISGSATLLEIGAPADAPRHLQNIQNASQRGARILRQLLALSPRTDGELVASAVAPLLEEAVAKVRESFPNSCALAVAIAPGLPEIRVDQTQVKQIVAILCDNAREAMPAGGQVLITAGARVLDETQANALGSMAVPGHYVVLRVEDTGRGIAADALPRVFEPFFSTKPKSKDSGAGLGLTIVFRLMLRHGGFVTVESEPNHGTTVACYFPVA